MTAPPVIGIDIGGTKIRAYRANGEAFDPVEYPTPQANGAAVVETLIEICDSLSTDHPIAAIGIGTAGQIDPVQGKVIASTGNIANWLGTDLKTPLAKRFNIPVAVENDVNVFALGEMSTGAGRDFNSALCLAIGTGVGGALVINGEIWSGASYSAGEAGYLFAGQDANGKPTLLESKTGGRALETIYQQRKALPDRPGLREITRRAQEDNDTVARDVITNGARLLGQVLGSVLTFIDPDVLIVGGGVPQIGDLWWQPFVTAVEAVPLRSDRSAAIRRAQLGTDAVMLGAAALARQQLSQTD